MYNNSQYTFNKFICYKSKNLNQPNYTHRNFFIKPMIQTFKQKTLILFFIITACFSNATHAGFNPFNKDKTFVFGAEAPWRANKTDVVKSGLNKHKGNNYYYHLSINKQRLLLQLSKNDADGTIKNSWPLETLEIFDVSVDGVTLSQFQWCLDNRINPASYPILTKDTVVKNNVCTTNTNDGNFIINLNKNSLSAIKHAAKLQVIIKLDKRITTLNYNMKGFDSAFNEFTSQQETQAKTVANTPTKNKKTALKEKPEVKTCLVKAPAKYADKIKPVSYPCNDRSLQIKAKNTISSKIALQKRKQKDKQVALQKRKKQAELKRKKQLEEKRLAKLEQKRLQEAEKKEQLERQAREKKWGKMETSMWLDRCKQKWAHGVSPCYCQSYVKEFSPKGIKNTCNKE